MGWKEELKKELKGYFVISLVIITTTILRYYDKISSDFAVLIFGLVIGFVMGILSSYAKR